MPAKWRDVDDEPGHMSTGPFGSDNDEPSNALWWAAQPLGVALGAAPHAAMLSDVRLAGQAGTGDTADTSRQIPTRQLASEQ